MELYTRWPWGLASFAQKNAVAVVLWGSEAHPFSCCVLSVVRVPHHLFIGQLGNIFMTSRFGCQPAVNILCVQVFV